MAKKKSRDAKLGETAAKPQTRLSRKEYEAVLYKLQAELVKLPGIGPSRAQAIIAQRKRRPFRRPEEILRVRGIGRKTFQRLRPYLRVKDPPKPRGG